MNDKERQKEDELLKLERKLDQIEHEHGSDLLTPQEKQDQIFQEIEKEGERVKAYFSSLIQNGLKQEMIQRGLHFFEWFESERIRLKEDTQEDYFIKIISTGGLVRELYTFWEFLEKIEERKRDSIFYM